MKLLVADNGLNLKSGIYRQLKAQGYIVDIANNGETAYQMAVNKMYDVIILERILNLKDGLSVLKALRAIDCSTPIMFLTTRNSYSDRVEGLEAGADDYVTKPFSYKELFARIHALSRRKCQYIANEESITIADLKLLPLRTQLIIGGKKIIKLSIKETQLLEILMRNCGKVVTKEYMFSKIWGYSDINPQNLDLYIHYLRKKLESSYITTIRGVGYLFQAN